MSAAVTQLGSLGVFMLMVPESACIPIPSEVTLLAAGVGVHRGLFGFATAVGAAALGNLSGSLVAYGVGRVGRPSLDRARRAIERCDAIFARHGDRAVFLGRLLPLVRSFVSVPAGRAAVPLPRFLALTLAGCAIWSAAFILLGEWAGDAWQTASGIAGRASLVVGLAACALLLRRGGARPRASARSRSGSRSGG